MANMKILTDECSKVLGRPYKFKDPLDMREKVMLEEHLPRIADMLPGLDTEEKNKLMAQVQKENDVEIQYAAAAHNALSEAMCVPGRCAPFMAEMTKNPFKFGLSVVDLLSSLNLAVSMNDASFSLYCAQNGIIGFLMTAIDAPAPAATPVDTENRIYIEFYTMVMARVIIGNIDQKYIAKLLPESDRALIANKVTKLLSRTTLCLLKYEAIRLLSSVTLHQFKCQSARAAPPPWVRPTACLLIDTCASLLKCNPAMIRNDIAHAPGMAVTTLVGRLTWSTAEVLHMAHPMALATKRTAADVAAMIAGLEWNEPFIHDYDCTLLWEELLCTILEAKDVLTDFAASAALRNIADAVTTEGCGFKLTNLFVKSILVGLRTATSPTIRLNMAVTLALLTQSCKDLNTGLAGTSLEQLMSIADSSDDEPFIAPAKTTASFRESLLATPYISVDRQCSDVLTTMICLPFALTSRAVVQEQRAILRVLVNAGRIKPKFVVLENIKWNTAVTPRAVVPDFDPSGKNRAKEQSRVDMSMCAASYGGECSDHHQCSGCISRKANEARLSATRLAEVCSNCSARPATGKIKKCSACLCVAYCSLECQKAHWKGGHKNQCKLFAAGGGK